MECDLSSANVLNDIVKIIHMFLVNNDFCETAKCFLWETKNKYGKVIDFSEPIEKTLILRPAKRHNQPKILTQADNLIVTIPIKYSEDIPKEINLFNPKISSELSSQINPSCSLLKQQQPKLKKQPKQQEQRKVDQSEAKCTQMDNTLIYQNHLKNRVKEETNILEENVKNVKCKETLVDFLTFATNDTMDIYLMMHDPGDRTEDQVESSVINSSRLSNHEEVKEEDLKSLEDDTSGSFTMSTSSCVECESSSSGVPSKNPKTYSLNHSPTCKRYQRSRKTSSAPLKTSNTLKTNEKKSLFHVATPDLIIPPRGNEIPRTPDKTDKSDKEDSLSIVVKKGEVPLERKSNTYLIHVEDINDNSAEDDELITAKIGANKLQISFTSPDYELDWIKIKKDLLVGNECVKMKLLQALRWRITRTKPEDRDKNLVNILKHDVLCMNSMPPLGQKFLESFYCPPKTPTPHTLQEEMSRFINTIASLSMGRLYLERDESTLTVMLLPLLMGRLPSIKISDLTREFTMATIQKLSLSNKLREVIISGGTVEWLVNFLEKNHGRMSNYEAEYSIALLTNLCINKEARNRCEWIADRVVQLMIDLIETPHKCCVRYINPIFYSLLLNRAIYEKSLSMGLGSKMKHLYTLFTDKEMLRQLDTIIDMYQSNDFCECEQCSNNETSGNEEYVDYLEPELVTRDEEFGDPNGENLLKLYRLTQEHAKVEVDKKVSSVQIIQKSCSCKNLNEELKICSSNNEQKNNRRKNLAQNTQNTKIRTRSVSRNSPDPPNTKQRNNETQKKLGPTGRRMKSPLMTKSQEMKKLSSNIPMIKKKIDGGKKPPQKQHQNNELSSNVTNCQYNIDYLNVLSKSPGEFVPQPTAQLTNNNANNANTDHNLQHSKYNCECYKEMHKFVNKMLNEDLLPQKSGLANSNVGNIGNMTSCAHCGGHHVMKKGRSNCNQCNRNNKNRMVELESEQKSEQKLEQKSEQKPKVKR